MATNSIQATKRIQKKLEPVAEELDQLISNLQDRYDAMSENMQDSIKGEALSERIDLLTDWHDELTNIIDEEV